MCCRQADCADRLCEAHPLGAAAQLAKLEAEERELPIQFTDPIPRAEDAISSVAWLFAGLIAIGVAAFLAFVWLNVKPVAVALAAWPI